MRERLYLTMDYLEREEMRRDRIAELVAMVPGAEEER